MAAVTTAAIAAGAIGVAGGAAKAIAGGKMKRDARRAARNFRRQELANVNEGRRISTMGADLAREEMARGTASSVAALQSGGIRGAIGGIGRVQRANALSARQIGAGLDEQQVALDREVAMDEARMRQMQEERDNQELSAIQAQMNAGTQTQWSGFGDIAQAGTSALSATVGAGKGAKMGDINNAG